MLAKLGTVMYTGLGAGLLASAGAHVRRPATMAYGNAAVAAATTTRRIRRRYSLAARSSSGSSDWLEDFTPPSWVGGALDPIPSTRVRLGQFPTPIQRWYPPHIPGLRQRNDLRLWVKRDDWSGFELGGNKVRKLEFLLADALEKGCDSVITIGGIQSNHARATAMAARLLGLEPHLILRTSLGQEDKDPGLVGNLLPERLGGAEIYLVTKNEYGAHGSDSLLGMVEERLIAQNKRPYKIPVGGSNPLGTWGYLLFVDELRHQTATCLGEGREFDRIVLATGSGGTATGVALGLHLEKRSRQRGSGHGLSGSSVESPVVTSFGVCDDPRYFYDMAEIICSGMGYALRGEDGHTISPAQLLKVEQAKGRGYAISSNEELRMMVEVARETGIVLDPVYSGKAYCGLVRQVEENPEKWKGDVLFLHTGGMLGMYDKSADLLDILQEGPPRSRHLFRNPAAGDE